MTNHVRQPSGALIPIGVRVRVRVRVRDSVRVRVGGSGSGLCHMRVVAKVRVTLGLRRRLILDLCVDSVNRWAHARNDALAKGESWAYIWVWI